MSKPKDLWSFLRKEIQAAQLKAPCDALDRGVPTKSDHGCDIIENSNQADQGDSVFGEVSATAEELRTKKLQAFLAETDKKQPPSSTTGEKDDRLLVLRKELEVIINAEFGASKREGSLIARQKAALLREITWLENENLIQSSPKSTKGSTKADLNNDLRELPPPITSREAAQIRKAELKREKEAYQKLQLESSSAGAFAKAIRVPKKRKVKEIIDDDLDGEEKLLLIGPPKEKKRESKKNPTVNIQKMRSTTGRWKSEIHDYFPASMGDEESLVEGGLLADVGKGERMALRRELAELGEKLAKADRMRR